MLCIVGRYFVLNFRIPTVFDIIPLELVRFRNSRYSVSSCSFSCPACPLSLSLSYFKCKSRKRLRSFSTEFDRFHPYTHPSRLPQWSDQSSVPCVMYIKCVFVVHSFWLLPSDDGWNHGNRRTELSARSQASNRPIPGGWVLATTKQTSPFPGRRQLPNTQVQRQRAHAVLF